MYITNYSKSPLTKGRLLNVVRREYGVELETKNSLGKVVRVARNIEEYRLLYCN